MRLFQPNTSLLGSRRSPAQRGVSCIVGGRSPAELTAELRVMFFRWMMLDGFAMFCVLRMLRSDDCAFRVSRLISWMLFLQVWMGVLQTVAFVICINVRCCRLM